MNLQGSQWSTIFYINLGVYLKSLGDNFRPATYNCHLQTRLSQLVPDQHYLSELLDIYKKRFDEIDRSDLISVLLDHGLPWLEECSTESGLKKELTLSRSVVHHTVWDLVPKD